MQAVDGIGAALRRDGAGYALILASALGALALGFAPTPTQRLDWFERLGPHLVQANLLALVAALGFWLRRRERERGLILGRADAFALAASALALLALALLVPGLMRIQSDESFLVGAAFGLHALHQPIVPHAGFFGPEGLVPLIAEPDKRGLLFPILLRPTLGAGFALERGFALNLLLAWLALAACYALARRWLAPASALCVLFVALASPVFVWSARSLGFEMLNLCLIAWSAVAATRAAATGDRGALLLLVLMAPLLPQARYESVLLGAFALALAPWLVHAHRQRLGRLAVALALAPMLFLPYAWQRAMPFDDDLAQAGVDHAFGLDLLGRHLLEFLRFWAQPSPYNPFGVVVLAGLLAGVAALWHARRRAPPRSLAYRVAAGWAVAVAIVTLLVLAYAWGDFALPGVVRMGLPITLVFALGSVAGLVSWRRRYTRSAAPELLLSGALLVGSLWSTATDMGYVRGELGPALNAARDWGRSAFPHCRVVYATSSGAFFMEHGWGAIPPDLLAERWSGMVQTMPELGIDAVVGVEILSGSRGVAIGATMPATLVQYPLEDFPVAPTARLRLLALDRADAPLPRGRANCPRVPGSVLAAASRAPAP